MAEINFDNMKGELPLLDGLGRADIVSRFFQPIDGKKFVDNRNCLALLAFGGTIQSAYVPEAENILPLRFNPALERMNQIRKAFGIAEEEVTGAVVCAVDSRDLSTDHGMRLLQIINTITNQRVIVTCGTHKLSVIADFLNHHFGDGKSDKIIGVTGSMLPPAITTHDGDFNIGGAVAAVNTLRMLRKEGIVFAHFHGNIYSGDQIRDINLHPSRQPVKFAAVQPSIL